MIFLFSIQDLKNVSRIQNSIPTAFELSIVTVEIQRLIGKIAFERNRTQLVKYQKKYKSGIYVQLFRR